MKNKPKGILFDLGDTILQVNKFDVVNGYIQALKTFHSDKLDQTDSLVHIVAEVEAFLKPFKEDSVLQYRTECIQKLIRGLLWGDPNSPSENFELELWKAATQFTPENGIREVLAFLKSENIKLGIISNSSFSGSVLEWELKKHDLHSFFSFVVSSADYGVRKPHPYLFQMGLKLLNLSDTETWFIGDKVQFDIQGASDANIFPIWYNRQKNTDRSELAHFEINNWLELIDLYKEI